MRLNFDEDIETGAERTGYCEKTGWIVYGIYTIRHHSLSRQSKIQFFMYI
jgi:hypothetical protein